MSPKPAKGPHLTYRPGLDGLRALAVIGVFLYHAHPHDVGGSGWLPGGFFGVDLFFVLSGYLITSILLIEWEHHRQINVLRFWGRRARRLFPAVVVVVLASLLLASIFDRNVLSQTRSDVLPSLFYFNNWHQIVASASYFNVMGPQSLLKHCWSYVERLRRSLPLLDLLGLAALGMTIWLFLTIHDYDSVIYQGGDLAAAFCFAVLIAVVAHPGTVLGQALSVAPLRWIGERSYGIYLWHWPIVELTKPHVDVSWTGVTNVVLRAALTVAAAALSYKFIEQPIRTGRLQTRLAEAGARRR